MTSTVVVQNSESRDPRNHLVDMLPLLDFGKIFPKVLSMVLLDHLDTIFEPIIQLVTGKMILTIGPIFFSKS